MIVISLLNLSDGAMNKQALEFMVFTCLQQEGPLVCLIVYDIRK